MVVELIKVKHRDNMSDDYISVVNSALKLTEEERATLIKNLLLSLENYPDNLNEQEWVSEIRRRKQEVDSGAVELIPADIVLKQARNLIS